MKSRINIDYRARCGMLTVKPPFPDRAIQASTDNPWLDPRLSVITDRFTNPKSDSSNIMPVRIYFAHKVWFFGRRDVVDSDDVPCTRNEIRLCEISQIQWENGSDGNRVCDRWRLPRFGGISGRVMGDLNSFV